ncbi:MAG: hypothetical protein IKO36_11085 [Bacteroidaceae bacterium]|nr:hypothetical protein [Bacteroidaceae bacterium]
MKRVVLATTPTIEYTFRSVVPSDIVSAELTIKKDGVIVVRKHLSDAEVLGDKMSFLLSQSDTLALGVGTAEVMLNWLDNNGICGVGKTEIFKIVPNHRREVME